MQSALRLLMVVVAEKNVSDGLSDSADFERLSSGEVFRGGQKSRALSIHEVVQPAGSTEKTAAQSGKQEATSPHAPA
jgi:cytidylate kinase